MIDTDGFIHITARLSRFAKIGGEMVPHLKVEEAIQQVLGGEENGQVSVVVTSIPDEKKGERLVVLHTPLEKSPEEICRGLSAGGLPNLWIPDQDCFIEVESIPVLGSGKIDLVGVSNLAKAHMAKRKGVVDVGSRAAAPTPFHVVTSAQVRRFNASQRTNRPLLQPLPVEGEGIGAGSPLFGFSREEASEVGQVDVAVVVDVADRVEDAGGFRVLLFHFVARVGNDFGQRPWALLRILLGGAEDAAEDRGQNFCEDLLGRFRVERDDFGEPAFDFGGVLAEDRFHHVVGGLFIELAGLDARALARRFGGDLALFDLLSNHVENTIGPLLGLALLFHAAEDRADGCAVGLLRFLAIVACVPAHLFHSVRLFAENLFE
jgi:hypothetical protein